MGKFVVPAILLTLAIPAFSQSTSVTVDAKANIYAAGRGVAFNGVVPPAVRFAAGAGKVVTFPGVSGTIACNGIAYEPLHGPDGTVNRCGGTGTNITSWAGISGIVHKTREMFLVGVFLDEREPADPAPDRLDFSTSENYTTLSPLIGQVFFIGDGRTSGGGGQQVTAPAAATRLYLGFADAVGFSGAPYAYNDNNGSLQVTVAGVTPFVPGPVGTGTSMTVNGKSSIFWSGLEVNWPTEMPPGWKFTAAPGRVMTVRASGSVTCKTGISAPPEGTAACGSKTDLEPWGAVSGIKHPTRSMFLVGVFLNDLKPTGWPPTALDFTNDSFTTLEPLIGQTFYIGTGAGKRFVVPHDATRVFLGYARSDLMIGNPGWYYQGGGSLTATIDLTAGADTGVSPVQVDAKSNLYAAGRETAFDGYLPPMVRLNPGPGKVLTVPQVTGKVRCCGGGYTTADGASYETNLNAYRGLSGIWAKWRGYFLAGVFLDDSVPDGAPPEKLVFTEPFEFRSLAPAIGQVFLIGDGVTSTGAPHEYAIPATATRLYLGFAMGRLFKGDPGYYWEASDSYTATVNIGGGTTPPPCTYALSETARQMPASAGTGSVTVTTAAGCAWTAVSAASWITVTTGATGSGLGTVSYSVAANTGAARTGTLTIAGQTLTISQAAGTAACTYAINPATQAVAAGGGTVTVQVTAGAGCAWTASSSAAWLTVSAGASGTGNGTVTLTAAANTAAARTGTATIAGQTLTVGQAAAASTSTVEITDVVNEADLTAAFAPGGAIIISGRNFAAATTRVDNGAPWPNQLQGISVEVTDSGRTLAAPIGGVGAGWVTAQLPFGISTAVDLRVVAPAGRSGARTISVAARSPRLYSADGSGTGPVWAYHADGYEVSASEPASRGEEILLLGTGFGAVSPPVPAGQLGIDPTAGGEPNRVSDTVEVEIQGITVRPRLAILDYFLVGAYAVVFTVPDQVTSSSPSLLVRVGGAPSQRDMSLPVEPGTGCTYSVSPSSAQVGAAGGSGAFSVTAGAACAWTASSSQTWLTVTSGASGTGNGTVTLTAAANTGAARSATATIAGQTVTVSQAAGAVVCTYAVDPTGFSVYHLAYQDNFQVVTAAGCAWTAVSDAAWLRITSAASGTGPARVAFEVSANPAMTERTGLIQVATATFTIRQMGAVATFDVDAKSNIFAAGRATAFNGLLPPAYRFTAGAGKVLALDAVNGATHCQGGTPAIPADGAAFCVSGSTDVLSYRGIGGIVHGRKVMFLVGVFLDDREPADPAPARLDFTNNEDYTSLPPLIGQVFFLGNGRTAANAQQTVVVPETATRLFLGFADAEAFQGAPGAYQDNTGGLTVSLRVAPGSGGGTGGGDGSGTSLAIDARSNIFAAGRPTAFDGLLPPSVRLTAGTGRSVTVTNATGTVRCSAGSAPMGPDGGTECSSNGTDITSYQGIAGVIHTRKTMFLVGVFLTDAEPADPAPAQLDFSSNEGFATLSPLIGQTFFIGDGMTGTGTGAVQQFAAPDAATRLFLGFADGYSLHGSPGYYGDNSGSLGVTVTGGSGGGAGCSYAVSPATLTVAAAGGASSVSVATTAACAWTAVSNAAWIRVTSAGSASGAGTANVTVDANSGAARSGTLTIGGQTVTVNQAAAGSGGTGLTIDARSNIFAAGRATAFDGLLPPSVRLTAGTGRSVTVTNATGTVRCSGGSTATGPDGGTECSTNGTDIASYQGIAGVIHTRKTMFLVGVFLTDAGPADPAPARLDFSNNDGFATLSPLIGQTFFIGDGLTGTGAVQQFVAPDAATRLFLGFADANGLHGSPGYYGDNSGSLGVTVSGGSEGGGAGCSYTVSPATLTVAAAGGASSVSVATTAACAWTAVSNAAWIRVTSAASAGGPGTVSVTVDANSAAARSGTLTIAGQTVTVSQAAVGGGTTCTYAIAPGSASFLAAGGTGRIDVTTQSGCVWTATSTAGWITFTAGQSGTGSGAVSYAVAANTNAGNRLGTISVGGKNHPVEQAGAAPPSTVTIAAGGVVDTASFSSGLAPGSLFSIFGTDLAATTKQADIRPWPTTLDGVTVEVTDGANTMKAPLIFVSPGQVNGQLPFELKGASVQLRVRNAKGDSQPATVAIAARAPRLFPWGDANAIVVHADFKLVSAEAPAQPGEYLVAFLVGMGAVNPPVAAGVAATASPLSELTEKVTMKLGGVEAKVLFAGLAPEWVGLYQVNFQMPAGVLPGAVAFKVVVGAQAAQSGLNVACGAAWTKAVEQDVGPAGGTVTTAAFSMTVPPGAVGASSKWTLSSGPALEPQPGQLGGWWRWQGIPRETRAPITFTLPKGTELAPGAAFVVVRPVHGKGELRVPLENRGGIWTAAIPARQQPATAAAKGIGSPVAAEQNAAADYPDWQYDEAFLAVQHGFGVNTDEEGRFTVFVHPDSMATMSAQGYGGNVVGRALGRAWEKMKLLGFGPYESQLWPVVSGMRTSMLVFVEESVIFLYSPHYAAYTYWNDAFLMLIDPAVLLEMRAGIDMEDRVASETAALLTTVLHFPVVDKLPAWSWWRTAVGSAISDLLSCRYSSDPSPLAIRTLLASGLEDEGTDSELSWRLGYGARPFIEYLLLAEKLSLPGEVLAQQRIQVAARPSEVLRTRLALPGLGARWMEFSKTLGRGLGQLDCSGTVDIPGDPKLSTTASPPLLQILVDLAQKVEATTRGATVDLSLPNLSARHMLITLPRSTEVEDEMSLSLVFPPPQNADDQVKVLAAALDADGKVVSEWLTVAPGGRVPWQWRQGDRLWIWVVQSRFGKPGEMTNVQVVLKLTPKDQGAPAPWPSPGPTNFYFDSFVPMIDTKVNFTGIQVWSSDYNTTVRWAYPYFTLDAPTRSYKDESASLTVSGTVDAARKVVQVSIDAKRPNTETRYNRLRITLKDLPCSYKVDGDYYNYTCEVSAAALRSYAGAYVTSFTDESWVYDFAAERWKLESTSMPDYNTVNPSVGDPNSAVLGVRFRGRL